MVFRCPLGSETFDVLLNVEVLPGPYRVKVGQQSHARYIDLLLIGLIARLLAILAVSVVVGASLAANARLEGSRLYCVFLVVLNHLLLLVP